MQKPQAGLAAVPPPPNVRTMTRPSEDDLIARFFAPLAGQGGLGLKDDAACVTPAPGQDLVLTVDAIVAGVHFFPTDPPESIARKALGVNLSDLAAKGADPLGFLLTLALPQDWTAPWLEAFAGALGEAAQASGCALLGGDTTRSNGPLWLSITAFGEVPTGRMVPRTGALPGDLICVTGSIGDAALGLLLCEANPPAWALDRSQQDELVDRYRNPRPRNALARAVRDHARAGMDVSDGLIGDLAKMMRASGVSAVVDLDRVPLSGAAAAAVSAQPALLEVALTGGDDYEILCTVPEERVGAFLEHCRAAGTPATPIGSVVSGNAPPEFRHRGEAWHVRRPSFSHF